MGMTDGIITKSSGQARPSRSFSGAVTESSRESPVPMEKATSLADRLQLMMNSQYGDHVFFFFGSFEI